MFYHLNWKILVKRSSNLISLLLPRLYFWRRYLEKHCFCYWKITDFSRFFFKPIGNARELYNPLSANPTKWSNKNKQFVGNLPINCLSVFDHIVKLALKGIILPNFEWGMSWETCILGKQYPKNKLLPWKLRTI